MTDDREPVSGRRWAAFILAEVFIFTTLVLVALWIDQHPGPNFIPGGLDKYDWHPVLMTFGFVGFMFNAILAFKMFKMGHGWQKGMHAALHTAAFGCVAVATVLMFQFHNAHSIPNLYSSHAVVGLFTLVCFGIQWLMGVGAFFMSSNESFKSWAAPLHRFFGVAVMCFTTATILLGTMDRQRITYEVVDPASSLPGEYTATTNKWANALAISTLLAATAVGLVLHDASKATGKDSTRIYSSDGPRYDSLGRA